MEVTAVIPMHNSRETIARALASIAGQTQPPARIIAVDDASSDDTPSVARATQLPALEIIELAANRGPGGARNAGVEAASTEWVAFLDADDTWEPTFLEEVLGAVQRTGADFAAAGGIREMVHRQPIVRLIDAPPDAADRTADFWRISRRFSPIVPSCAFIRRDLYRRAGGFPEDMRTGEDIVFFGRLWLDGRFAFVNRPLYRSGQRRGGLSEGPRSYRDTFLFSARLGGVLLHAMARRRPGTRAFLVTYVTRVTRRHVTWLTRLLRRR